MFHNLINNEAPSLGNWLIDPAWNIILIDNSRAFTTGAEFVHEFARVDRELWDCRLVLGQWLTDGEIRGILRRWDVMAEKIQEMVDERGPQHVFVRFATDPSSMRWWE